MDAHWPGNLSNIKDRCFRLLQTQKWCDVKFLVGTLPDQCCILGHKIILGMASPVFAAMLFGNLKEDDVIDVPDVQPQAFHHMLQHMYADDFGVSSYDEACDLYYAAKKYILPDLVEECTKFLLKSIAVDNAVRAYEMGEFYNEPRIMQKSMKFIKMNATAVLSHSTFLDINASSLITIFDADDLNVNSELDLFNALVKLANKRMIFIANPSEIKAEKNVSVNTGENIDKTLNVVQMVKNLENKVADLQLNASDDHDASGTAKAADMNNTTNSQDSNETTIRRALTKIRFLTLTPKEFAAGPAQSRLLTKDEAAAIFINLLCSDVQSCPMPQGFSISRDIRKYKESVSHPVVKKKEEIYS